MYQKKTCVKSNLEYITYPQTLPLVNEGFKNRKCALHRIPH